ncbi:MAG: 4a-hydroxytetrahydrobiopterin dehydratase [Phycisphaerales bacterium]|nr:4a-hydroxytetrahydrobiopterin dehydratase [Phycisphaerales bacterium]
MAKKPTRPAAGSGPSKAAAAPSAPTSAGGNHAPVISDAEIETRLTTMPEWGHVGEALQRTFIFPDFVKAMTFVDRVAEEAEKAQHHPDILIRYNKVTMTLSTHDSGGITQKDFDLAQAMDRLA